MEEKNRQTPLRMTTSTEKRPPKKRGGRDKGNRKKDRRRNRKGKDATLKDAALRFNLTQRQERRQECLRHKQKRPPKKRGGRYKGKAKGAGGLD
jgi:hypothetical protein